jgi:hypothetical protein
MIANKAGNKQVKATNWSAKTCSEVPWGRPAGSTSMVDGRYQ